MTLEALNFQIEIVADELVPLPAGLSSVSDEDQVSNFVGQRLLRPTIAGRGARRRPRGWCNQMEVAADWSARLR